MKISSSKKKMQSLEIRDGSSWNTFKINKMVNGSINKRKSKIHGPIRIAYNKKDIANIFADHFE